MIRYVTVAPRERGNFGSKRVCAGCSTRFYDLGAAEGACPRCHAPYGPVRSETVSVEELLAAMRARGRRQEEEEAEDDTPVWSALSEDEEAIVVDDDDDDLGTDDDLDADPVDLDDDASEGDDGDLLADDDEG